MLLTASQLPWAPGVWARDAAESEAEAAVAEAIDAVVEGADAVVEDAIASSPADPAQVGWIELTGELREGPVPFAWVTEAEAGPSLSSVQDQLRLVAQSDEYAGVVVFLDQPLLTFAQASALRMTMQQTREAGKDVLVFAEVYDALDYYLASAADTVVLQRKGGVELVGLAVEEMYLAGLLEKIGVQADLLQIGRYKGADEALVREEPSPEWDENIDGLLDGLYGHITRTIAQARGLSVEQLEAAMAASLVLTDEQLLERGIVDAVADRSLLGVTEDRFGQEFEWDTQLGARGGKAMPDNPLAMFALLFETPKPVTRRTTLAVIHARGPIFSGESTIGDGLFADDTIGSTTMARELGDALLDENIKGVVIRLDSPGGSALASEVIWQAVRELESEKPVYVSIGGMAASGGYYIACAGRRVYVEPPTIVGSIGVVGGKLVMPGLYDWAGISITRRSRGPLGDLFNSVEPFTDPQREMVRHSMQIVYDQFRDRVAIGRGDRLPDLDAVDEGMLFTGTQAVDNGMADAVGGLDLALADLADELDLVDGTYDIVDRPAPMSLTEYFNSVLGVRGPAVRVRAEIPAVAAAQQVMGPQRWRQAASVLEGLTQLRREPVLLLHPAAVSIHAGRR